METGLAAHGHRIPRRIQAWNCASFPQQSEKNLFYAETHFMFKTILVLGISPVTVTREGCAECMLWSKKTKCCVALLLVFQTFTLTVFIRAATVVTIKSYDFKRFSEYLVILVVLFPAVISPMATWLEKEGVVTYINSWSLLQKHYKSLTSTTMENIFEGVRRRSKVGTFVSLLFPSMVGLWTVHYSLTSDVMRNVIGLLPCTYGSVTNYLFFGFWLVNIRVISRLIKDYGEHFEKQIVHNPRATSRMIEEYRLLWVEISMLTHRLSSLFIEKISTHFIVQMANSILSMYIWIFYLVDGDNDYKIDGFLLHVFYVFSSLLLLLSYCNSGYVIAKLSEKRVFSKLLTADSFSRHKSSKTKIVLFLYSVKCFPPKISLSGFHGINRETLLKILGASVTHIVVLIQFRLANEDSLHLFKNRTPGNLINDL